MTCKILEALVSIVHEYLLWTSLVRNDACPAMEPWIRASRFLFVEDSPKGKGMLRM